MTYKDNRSILYNEFLCTNLSNPPPPPLSNFVFNLSNCTIFSHRLETFPQSIEIFVDFHIELSSAIIKIYRTIWQVSLGILEGIKLPNPINSIFSTTDFVSTALKLSSISAKRICINFSHGKIYSYPPKFHCLPLCCTRPILVKITCIDGDPA